MIWLNLCGCNKFIPVKHHTVHSILEEKKKEKKKIGRPNQKSFTFLLLELIIPRLVKKYSIVLGVEYESKSVCDKSTETNFKLGALKNMLFLFCLG